MRRVFLADTAFRRFGALMLVVGIGVVIVIYPILGTVEGNREIMQENDRDSGVTRWDHEMETGFLLLVLAMSVGQLMAFTGLIMMVTGAVKSYMSMYLPPKIIQCDNCRIWFDMKYLWCPRCDKPVTEAMYINGSAPHMIKKATPAAPKK